MTLGMALLLIAALFLIAWSPTKAESSNQPASANVLEALSTLYTTTGGAGWEVKTNWFGAETADPCTGRWYGVYCIFGSVLRVELNTNRMVGTLPTELALLGSELIGALRAEDIGGLVQ